MTTSPTPAERAALKVAQAATMTPDASYDMTSAIVFALGSAQLLMAPETAAELEALRGELSGRKRAYADAVASVAQLATERTELEKRAAADRTERDHLRARVSELEQQITTARNTGYAAAIEVMRQEKLPMSVGLLEAQRELDALEAGVTPWQRATDGLNALVDAGIPFHVEPDGHISNPCGDEHIEWDRTAERWRLVVDDDEPDADEPVPFMLTEPTALVTTHAEQASARLRRLGHPLDRGVRS